MSHCFSSALTYIAIDWDPDMKKKYYNENEAEVRSVMSSLISKNRSVCRSITKWTISYKRPLKWASQIYDVLLGQNKKKELIKLAQNLSMYVFYFNHNIV